MADGGSQTAETFGQKVRIKQLALYMRAINCIIVISSRPYLKEPPSAIRHPLSNQSGQVAILVALLAASLFSAAALVVDVGAAYEARRALQTSVDAAALAGAMDLAEKRGPDAAGTTARDYLARNFGPAADHVTASFPTGTSVRVDARADQRTYFARIFGHEQMPIKASATASFGLAGKVYNLLPVIVPYQRIAAHIGAENQAVFELGSDRPMEELSIIYAISGSRVTYTVTYVNNGNKAVDLEMWSPIPSGAAYVTGSATGGGTFDGTYVRWSWSGVASGDRRLATFVVDFSGSVYPKNEVYVSINGGPAKSASTDNAQKGYFWLTDFNDGSGGTPDFADWIINGYPDAVGLGIRANGVGVRSSLSAAMDARLAKDPSVILPLYDYTEAGGSIGQYHVVGFAEFVLTAFTFSGNPKTIAGYFTNGTVTPGVGAGGESAVDFGVNAVWLSE